VTWLDIVLVAAVVILIILPPEWDPAIRWKEWREWGRRK
jgi:hypothetical protein